jgi:RimJ/RimL family protein N-acetyltransferase
MPILDSARLRFEPMQDAHYDGLRRLNSDPLVMRFISGQPETPDDTHAAIARVKARWETLGYAWWSLIERDSGELIGAGCIQHLGHDTSNPHEIGWRLRPDRWGQGYAIEAAERMARFAFDDLGVPLLCAICDPENVRHGVRHRPRHLGASSWRACLNDHLSRQLPLWFGTL